jgi:hypothetical protein
MWRNFTPRRSVNLTVSVVQYCSGIYSSFPPPALPGFIGTTSPSATLPTRPVPRGLPVWCVHTTDRVSRVASFLIFHACQCQYPGRNRSVLASLASQSAIGLPLVSGGSTSALFVSRPARHSLAFRPAWSLSRPRRPVYTKVLQSMLLPP